MEKLEGVLVCGAGPVGLLTALGSGPAGDQGHRAGGRTGRQPGAACQRLLPADDRVARTVRPLRDVAAVAYRSHEVQFHFGLVGSVVQMSLSALEGAARYPFFLHVGQHVIGEIALAHLSRLPHFDVRWNHTVAALEQDATGVTVTATTLDGPVALHADWAIGTDGARSSVRRLLNLPFEASPGRIGSSRPTSISISRNTVTHRTT